MTAGMASGDRAVGVFVVPEAFSEARGAVQLPPATGSKLKLLTLVCHPGPGVAAVVGAWFCHVLPGSGPLPHP